MDLLFPEALSTGVGLFLLAASAVTSMLTAVLGAGGGVLLLVLMATWIPPAAIIPVHGMIQLGSNTGRAVLTFRHIDWRVILAFAPGVVAGAALGAWLLFNLPAHLWQLTIAGFVLYLCWGPKLPKASFRPAGIFLASAITSFIRPFQNRIHLCRRHDPAACAQSPGVRLCRLCVLGMATVHCRHDCLRLCRHLAGAAPAEHHDQPLVQPGVQRGADPVGTAAVMAGGAVSRLVRLTHLRTVSKSSQPVATHSHSYL